MAAAQPATTVRQALVRAQERLARLENARREAEILLAAALDTRRESFYADPDRRLPLDRLADFHCLIDRRHEGYPIAYLTGRREFWSLELRVNSHALIPRPETETLVTATLARIPDRAPRDILDLGTGSGAVALALARERPACRITATDISREALALARQNALEAGLGQIRFLGSDWFCELEGQRFDVIACNPPYVESGYAGLIHDEIRFEPRLALDGGPAGLTAIQRIVPAAMRHIHPGGWLILEHGCRQAEAVRRLLLTNHYRESHTLQDLAGLDRVTLARTP